MKNKIITIIVIVLVALGAYFIIQNVSNKGVPANDQVKLEDKDLAENEPAEVKTEDKTQTIIGASAGGRNITAYHYGDGEKEILFVGGIHGGYEWNTVLVARELMDYLKSTPSFIPEGVQVTVIPVLNPDGLNRVVGTDGLFTKTDIPTSQATVISGRFNGNNVDLNRNFDCDWQANAKWQNKDVSGGSAAFSETESQAIKDYVATMKPTAVVVWYSAAGGVYSSNCHNGILPETATLTDIFAKASGYPAFKDFNFYEITGDMVNWLAKEQIPAISVLLTNHEDTEWSKNVKGIEALLKHYAI